MDEEVQRALRAVQRKGLAAIVVDRGEVDLIFDGLSRLIGVPGRGLAGSRLAEKIREQVPPDWIRPDPDDSLERNAFEVISARHGGVAAEEIHIRLLPVAGGIEVTHILSPARSERDAAVLRSYEAVMSVARRHCFDRAGRNPFQVFRNPRPRVRLVFDADCRIVGYAPAPQRALLPPSDTVNGSIQQD